MAEVFIDKFPKSELESRYDIKTTALNNRLSALGVETLFEGRKAFIKGEDLHLLDTLDKHLKRGGTLADFVTELMVRATPKEETYGKAVITLDYNYNDYNEKRLKQNLLSSDDPFIDLTLLQKLADLDWAIDTKRLAAILGLSFTTLRKRKTISHCGFSCYRVGKERGGIVWKVKKTDFQKEDEQKVIEARNFKNNSLSPASN